MFLESRFGSRDPLLGILAMILENLWGSFWKIRYFLKIYDIYDKKCWYKLFIESRYGSRNLLLGILSRIVENFFEDPFEKYAFVNSSFGWPAAKTIQLEWLSGNVSEPI